MTRRAAPPGPLLILASGSPRRQELIGRLGLPFIVLPSDVAEMIPPGLAPEEVARLLARQKAAAVAARQPGRVVIGADTVVIPYPGQPTLLGKPRGDADAARMLRALRGRWHRVATGIAVVRDGQEWHDVVSADVRMGDYSDAEIATYVASGEPRDKAGAYAVQGLGGRLVVAVAGSELAVVGLPLRRLAALLDAAGVAVPVDPATIADRWWL